MSEVTFTVEQIREIRHRICTTQPGSFDVSRDAVLRCFPLPKVTRYRTFTPSDETTDDGKYRMRDGQLEYWNVHHDPEEWFSCDAAEIAKYLISVRDWRALAALADICQRPTEEVDP